MKLTIIKDDNAVYKNGVSFEKLNLITIPSEVHALQWNETFGHIEYVDCIKPNENIDALPDWANDCLTAWENANTALQAAQVDALPATL
jgi:hypothetical protein